MKYSFPIFFNDAERQQHESIDGTIVFKNSKQISICIVKYSMQYCYAIVFPIERISIDRSIFREDYTS